MGGDSQARSRAQTALWLVVASSAVALLALAAHEPASAVCEAPPSDGVAPSLAVSVVADDADCSAALEIALTRNGPGPGRLWHMARAEQSPLRPAVVHLRCVAAEPAVPGASAAPSLLREDGGIDVYLPAGSAPDAQVAALEQALSAALSRPTAPAVALSWLRALEARVSVALAFVPQQLDADNATATAGWWDPASDATEGGDDIAQFRDDLHKLLSRAAPWPTLSVAVDAARIDSFQVSAAVGAGVGRHAAGAALLPQHGELASLHVLLLPPDTPADPTAAEGTISAAPWQLDDRPLAPGACALVPGWGVVVRPSGHHKSAGHTALRATVRHVASCVLRALASRSPLTADRSQQPQQRQQHQHQQSLDHRLSFLTSQPGLSGHACRLASWNSRVLASLAAAARAQRAASLLRAVYTTSATPAASALEALLGVSDHTGGGGGSHWTAAHCEVATVTTRELAEELVPLLQQGPAAAYPCAACTGAATCEGTGPVPAELGQLLSTSARVLDTAGRLWSGHEVSPPPEFPPEFLYAIYLPWLAPLVLPFLSALRLLLPRRNVHAAVGAASGDSQ